MSVANTYPQSDTPLPQVAARAARQALAAARPHTLTIAQTLAKVALTAAILTGLSGAFAILIAHTFH
jgi:hypothetical protein